MHLLSPEQRKALYDVINRKYLDLTERYNALERACVDERSKRVQLEALHCGPILSESYTEHELALLASVKDIK